MVGRRQEDTFHARRQPAIHIRQLEFVFEIRNRPQATQNDGSPLFLHKMGKQVAETGDADIRDVCCGLAHQFAAFVQVEQGILFRVVRHADHDFIKHPAGPFDQIGVAVGDGVKGARVDYFGHAPLLSSKAVRIPAMPARLKSGDRRVATE